MHQGTGVILDKPYFENHTYVDVAPLTGDIRTHFHGWLREIMTSLAPPHLILDLRASPELILTRISSRGREMEKTLTLSWFEQLARAHEQSLPFFPDAPILKIDSNANDFLGNPQDFEKLIRSIESSLLQAATDPHTR